MQMWSCPWVHFWFWKRNLHFGKNCLTKFETKHKWAHLHNSGCWMITFLKWSSNFCWHWNCWFFTEGPQKGKLNPLAIWRCDIYIYIYRICIYIYLHTYKYDLHTYTYYIYIFDIGVSESKLPVSAFWFKKAERVFFTAWEAVAGCCDTNDVSCVRRLRDMPHAHNPVQICTCRCELLAKHQPDIRYFFAKCSCIFWYQRKIMHIVTWPDK